MNNMPFEFDKLKKIEYEYDCQDNHKQVGSRCIKCNVVILDFSPECEGNGYNGWKRMEGIIDYTHAPKELKDKLNRS